MEGVFRKMRNNATEKIRKVRNILLTPPPVVLVYGRTSLVLRREGLVESLICPPAPLASRKG